MAKSKVIDGKAIELIKADLSHAQSPKRRAAAKKVGKFQIYQLKVELFDAYLKERKDSRTWETQTEMIKSLGRIGCTEVLPYLEEIIKINVEFDAITDVAAAAYVRLKSRDKEYVPIIYQLFEKGKFAVRSGALHVLFYDQIIPKNEDIVTLANLVNASNHPEDDGFMDLRQTLACAMSLWPKEIVAPYLESYKKIQWVSKDVIEHALKGKSYCASEY